MIKLPDNIRPANDVLNKLIEYQGEIDALPTFAERVVKAKKSFSAKNKNTNKYFNAVKEKLTEMCSGARRCAYCEDSVADEVEHIRPKNHFPESCFVWENYVYACGPCNGPKNDKFAVVRNDNGNFYEVDKHSGDQPPLGEDALINPRNEDPLDYCMLDLRDTFKFVIIKPAESPEHKKADYTFNQVLRLNDQREYLREGRKKYFGNYRARLHSYSILKAAGAAQEKLDTMIREIRSEAHPTVWQEMKRYYSNGFFHSFDSDLHNLFFQNQEALTW